MRAAVLRFWVFLPGIALALVLEMQVATSQPAAVPQPAAAAFSQKYEDFYSQMHDRCTKTAVEQGMEADCDSAEQACLNFVFTCVRDNACSLKMTPEGNQLACTQDPASCADVSVIIVKYKQEHPDLCPSADSAMDPEKPGCGNKVVEPGETCDDGNQQDGDACPAQCGKTIEAVDPITPPTQGGAGTGPTGTTGGDSSAAAPRTGPSGCSLQR